MPESGPKLRLGDNHRRVLSVLLRGVEQGCDQIAGRSTCQSRRNLSSLWVMLENCRPRRMKGYGVSFPPETRQLIEQKLEGLLERVAALRSALSDK